MAIKYTVVATTKRCPYCERIVDTETHGEYTPLLIAICILAFPVVIPYWLIRFLAFDDPFFPKIGPKSYP